MWQALLGALWLLHFEMSPTNSIHRTCPDMVLLIPNTYGRAAVPTRKWFRWLHLVLMAMRQKLGWWDIMSPMARPIAFAVGRGRASVRVAAGLLGCCQG
jgi:hypothetical protein